VAKRFHQSSVLSPDGLLLEAADVRFRAPPSSHRHGLQLVHNLGSPFLDSTARAKEIKRAEQLLAAEAEATHKENMTPGLASGRAALSRPGELGLRWGWKGR
jgi:hypothetical protein